MSTPSEDVNTPAAKMRAQNDARPVKVGTYKTEIIDATSMVTM